MIRKLTKGLRFPIEVRVPRQQFTDAVYRVIDDETPDDPVVQRGDRIVHLRGGQVVGSTRLGARR